MLLTVRDDYDLADLHIELVLAHLFENKETREGYRLSPHLRGYTTKYMGGLAQVYMVDVMQEMFEMRRGVSEQELVRMLMNDFLEPRAETYFSSMEKQLWSDVEALGVRTRAFEMGLAAHLLERYVFSDVLQYDTFENKKYFMLKN